LLFLLPESQAPPNMQLELTGSLTHFAQSGARIEMKSPFNIVFVSRAAHAKR